MSAVSFSDFTAHSSNLIIHYGWRQAESMMASVTVVMGVTNGRRFNCQNILQFMVYCFLIFLC